MDGKPGATQAKFHSGSPSAPAMLPLRNTELIRSRWRITVKAEKLEDEHSGKGGQTAWIILLPWPRP